MGRRRLRLGIRAQLTLTVLLAAILTTAATLFIARNAIHTYALDQAKTQQQESMSIATLVLETAYGQNISVSSDTNSDNALVLDSPSVGHDQGTTFNNQTNYGKYVLNNDTDYVDAVQQRVGGAVSVYQCADKNGNFTGCQRIATTFHKAGSGVNGVPQRDTGSQLCGEVISNLSLDDTSKVQHEWVGADPNATCGNGFYGDYRGLYNPQGQFIGVLYVGEPLDTVAAFENRTALQLLLLGVIIMTAGVILALLFASAIVNTLQRVARQVSGASERIGGMAAQQAGGAAQQVWAVNAVNKALQNFQDMARDISQRTDQLSLMGGQVIQRRAEFTPQQIDSILAYMTRSVREISTASKQQSAQYERMSGAMQAVIEIAEQVAGNSQQSSESAERLQLVVRQLQQLMGVRYFNRRVVDAGFDGGQDMAIEWNAQARNGRQMMGVPPEMDGYGQMPMGGAREMARNGGRQGGMGMPMPAGARMGARRDGSMPAMGGPMPRGMRMGTEPGRGQAPMNGHNGRMGMPPNGYPRSEQDWHFPPMPPLPAMPEMPQGSGMHPLRPSQMEWGRMPEDDRDQRYGAHAPRSGRSQYEQ